MKIKTEKHYSCDWFWNYKPVRKCHNVVKTVTHYKKKPECKTVPKYHCEEKWDVDQYGKKVSKVKTFDLKSSKNISNLLIRYRQGIQNLMFLSQGVFEQSIICKT